MERARASLASVRAGQTGGGGIGGGDGGVNTDSDSAVTPVPPNVAKPTRTRGRATTLVPGYKNMHASPEQDGGSGSNSPTAERQSPTAAGSSNPDGFNSDTLIALSVRLRYLKSQSANPEMVESNIQAVQRTLKMRSITGRAQVTINDKLIKGQKLKNAFTLPSSKTGVAKQFGQMDKNDDIAHARESVVQGIEVPKTAAEAAAAAIAAANRRSRRMSRYDFQVSDQPFHAHYACALLACLLSLLVVLNLFQVKAQKDVEEDLKKFDIKSTAKAASALRAFSTSPRSDSGEPNSGASSARSTGSTSIGASRSPSPTMRNPAAPKAT